MNENSNYRTSLFDKERKSNHRAVITKDVSDRIKAVRLIMASQELADQQIATEKCASDLRAAHNEIASQSEENEKHTSDLVEANKELANQSEEKKKLSSELNIANKEIARQNKEKEEKANALIVANEELVYQNKEKEKRASELVTANTELLFQNEEKEKRAFELLIANDELHFQNEEKEKRAAELGIANEELTYQNEEKEKRAAELIVANEELAYQNEEKEKRAAELIIANEELAYQNEEKEKRAAELVVANEELLFQNEEKEKRATELGVANEELAYQNEEKEKRASELIVANEELAYQNEEKEKRATELGVANEELSFQNQEKEKRATELIIANKELRFQNKEKKKRAAEQQFASNNLDAMINNSTDLMWSVDKDFNLLTSNKPFEDALKLTSGTVAVKGENILEAAYSTEESKKYKKLYERAFSGESFTEIIHNKSPEDSWAEISYHPIRQGDKIVGTACHSRDITSKILAERELKKTNESLQKHVKELAISNEELEQFAFVASHDLQEPLRMITSFMGRLEQKYGELVGEKGRQYIHYAVDGAKRMRQIILDLLNFSRVGRVKDNPEDLEEVDFNILIGEILPLYRRQTEELGASISFDNLPVLQINKARLRQVFQNLIGNSLKYHRDGVPPVISIQCKETKTHFQFSVEDNGIGIEAEFFDKIFIIFQRLHNKDEYSGTGMGLTIVKKIVGNLGGKTWVKSIEGKGSTFYFTILKKR